MMETICKNCHWYKPKREHAHIINCIQNLDYREKTDACKHYCEDGKYVPTGEWGAISNAIKAVAEILKKEVE